MGKVSCVCCDVDHGVAVYSEFRPCVRKQGIVGGKLRLKGIDSKKKKKKRKKNKESDERDTAIRDVTSATSASAGSGQTLPTSAPGSGQILTSGTSVMGKGTNLQEELHVGDTITVLNESTLVRAVLRLHVRIVIEVHMVQVEETRRIVMVLGPTAAALRSLIQTLLSNLHDSNTCVFFASVVPLLRVI